MLIFKTFAAFAGAVLIWAGVTERLGLTLRDMETGEHRQVGIVNAAAIFLGVCVIVSAVWG